MLDRQGRTIEYLRVSVTDRCNHRCVYCMPEGGVESMAHGDVLTFEEIVRIVRLASELGMRVVRVIDGEPMARRWCLELVQDIHDVPGIKRVVMTTNDALLLGRMVEAKATGLSGVNISLVALDPATFRRITRLGDVREVFTALDETLACGLQVKVNAVPVRGLNEDSLTAVAELARIRPVDVRFIELMPVDCGAAMQPVPTDEVIRRCLNHQSGLDLRAMLRSRAGDAAITAAMREAIARKPSRHGFLEDVADREIRRMNEIGG